MKLREHDQVNSLTHFSYPSEYLAVCQSYCNLPGGGLCTNIFSPSPDHSIVGTFTPFGHGSICLPSSSTITMMFNQEGGLVTNKDGEMAREWKWPRDGKLAQPVIIQVNEYITVRIAGRFAISLIYNWQHESVCLSLSPLQGAALPQLEELPKLTELLKKYKGPEETISHVNDISAARELRKLQRKIRSIVEDWLEHYRTALGTDSTHIQKMSDFPLQLSRKCKIQSADALSVTSVMQRSKGKRKDNSQATKSESPLLLDQLQSAPPHNMQQEPCSYSLRVISQTACPAVLRRIMMGEEGKTCRCSNRKIPNVSDLEYDHLINNQMSSKEQIVVVCVSSSSQIKKDPSEDKLEQLYERKNKNRSMPCAQMYIQGKLLFANYIFNGYSKSTEDLQKQVAKTRSDYRMGYCLPSNFRFRYFTFNHHGF
ncbi:uncharacterized protein C3orf20 [Struthio camelus]|uniref:uncharacterized protein C3orf20 n=1 Tax=Struthio camelus TaxID=8801 RepID=UPI003603E414